MPWNWMNSFIVKDAINICRKASNNDRFVSSFQPKLLKRLTGVVFDCPERPSDFCFDVVEPDRLFDSICLTSGGADSTIAWYYAGKPPGLYIDIGQPYAQKERDALSRLGIPYQYVDLRGTHLADKTWKHIIPGRNFLFLALAAEMVVDQGNVWFAMVEGEGAESDKGDKSLMFVSLFQDWYTAVTGRSVYVQDMTLHTKPGWLRWFSKNYDINIIRKDTVTCFAEEKGQCGKCQACLRKYLSFMSLDIDIAEDFVAHPMFGAVEYVQKYEQKLAYALGKGDFSHYSRHRCIEDLSAIAKAKELMITGQSQ